MDRHPLHNHGLAHGYPNGPRRLDPNYCQWAVVVGDRIRRMRMARGWTLHRLAQLVLRPDGQPYSLGYVSKIERGWANSPFRAYLAIAAAFDVDPGRIFGSDDAMLDVTEPELTLLRTLRQLEIAPHEALALLTQARSTAIRSSSPSMRVESPPPS